MIRRYATIALALLISSPVARAQDAPQAAMPSKMALTVSEAIDLAWKNNVTSIRERNNLDLAEASRREARQTYLPRLSLGLDFRKSNTPQRYFVNEQEFLSPNRYGFGLEISQPIFDGLNYIHTPKARTARIHSQEQRVVATRQQVALDAKTYCYGLLKEQMLAEVQQRAVQRSQEQLQTSNARYELGSASMSDFLKAKVQLGRDSLELITRLNNIEIARAKLNDFLGLPVDRKTEVEVSGLQIEPYPLPTEEARESSIETHPTVLEASYARTAAAHDVGSAQSSMWPAVSASAGYSYSAGRLPEGSDEVWKGDNHYVGLALNWTIFSGYATSSQVKQKKIAEYTAEEELAAARRSVSLQITESALRVDEAFKRHQVAQDQVRSAQEDLDIAQEKYNLGAATILDILTAQVSLSQAETDRIQAAYDYFLAIAQLEWAMGGGD